MKKLELRYVRWNMILLKKGKEKKLFDGKTIKGFCNLIKIEKKKFLEVEDVYTVALEEGVVCEWLYGPYCDYSYDYSKVIDLVSEKQELSWDIMSQAFGVDQKELKAKLEGSNLFDHLDRVNKRMKKVENFVDKQYYKVIPFSRKNLEKVVRSAVNYFNRKNPDNQIVELARHAPWLGLPKGKISSKEDFKRVMLRKARQGHKPDNFGAFEHLLNGFWDRVKYREPNQDYYFDPQRYADEFAKFIRVSADEPIVARYLSSNLTNMRYVDGPYRQLIEAYFFFDMYIKEESAYILGNVFCDSRRGSDRLRSFIEKIKRMRDEVNKLLKPYGFRSSPKILIYKNDQGVALESAAEILRRYFGYNYSQKFYDYSDIEIFSALLGIKKIKKEYPFVLKSAVEWVLEVKGRSLLQFLEKIGVEWTLRAARGLCSSHSYSDQHLDFRCWSDRDYRKMVQCDISQWF